MSDLFMSMQQRRLQRANAKAETDDTAQEQAERAGRRAAASIEADDQSADEFANLLSLQLRKPAHWNWELTTSRSCSNIALPRILLYDHTGALLVDANTQTEQSYRAASPASGAQHSALGSLAGAQRRHKRASTASLGQSLRSALYSDFHGLQIAEATPSTTPTERSPAPQSLPSGQLRKQLQAQHSGSCIDFSTHELPNDYAQRRSRSSSLRGVRFREGETETGSAVAPLCYPTPPSTSTLTTTANSSSSGPREKRRYKRSQSSGRTPEGSSILERFSMSKGRHSSPEYAVEQQVRHAPRYFLRTCKAGTLVIQEESFSRVRQRRRRPRHSSSENMLNLNESAAGSGSVRGAGTAMGIGNGTDSRTAAALPAMRKRACSQRRLRVLSTSEEEEQEQEAAARQRGTRKATQQPTRGRRTQRNCVKDVRQELITIDPDNCVYRSAPGATAR